MPKNNSALRAPLVRTFASAAPPSVVSSLLHCSNTYVQKVQAYDEDSAALRATVTGYTVARLDPSVKASITTFLDIEIPVLSGRDYRLLTYSKQELFNRYEGWCERQGSKAVSSSTFWRRCKKEKIHNSLSGLPCPHCATLKELEEIQDELLTSEQRSRLAKARKHEAAAIAQRRSYRDARASLTSDDVMIVQDFTYHDYVQLGYQDLVVVFIWKDKHGDEHTTTRHYIANQGDKNDVLFSIHAWEKLAADPRVAGKNVFVWSDNGPKHFKCTAYITYMMMWAWRHAKRSKRGLRLSFFAPYHGASVADRGAAVVKRRVADRIASQSLRMKTNEALIQLANTVLGQEAEPIDLPTAVPKPDLKTMVGITKYYEWAPAPGACAEAWFTTEDRMKNVPAVTYPWPAAKSFPVLPTADGSDLHYVGVEGQPA